MAELKHELTHRDSSQELEILWLNEDDMVEAGVLDSGHAVDVMEETMGLLNDGDVIM